MTRNKINPANEFLVISKKLMESLNLILDPAAIFDFKGNIVATNDRFNVTTGFRRDELEGKNILKTEFISSKKRVYLMRKCFEKSEKGKITSFEIEIDKKNGEKIFVEATMQEIECRKKVAKLIVFHNVTDRNNRETALRESEERYQSLCEDAKILLLTSDLKGNICFSNKIAETYGFIHDDFIGKNMANFVCESFRQKIVSIHLNVVSGRKVEEEIEIITSKGVFTVDYFSSPIIREGKITGCHIAMIDISEKKNVSRKIEKYAHSAYELQEAYRINR